MMLIKLGNKFLPGVHDDGIDANKILILESKYSKNFQALYTESLKCGLSYQLIKIPISLQDVHKMLFVTDTLLVFLKNGTRKDYFYVTDLGERFAREFNNAILDLPEFPFRVTKKMLLACSRIRIYKKRVHLYGFGSSEPIDRPEELVEKIYKYLEG